MQGVWYPANTPVEVRDHMIPGGLIYVGKNLPSLQVNSYDSAADRNDAALINPKLKVTRQQTQFCVPMEVYWPTYAQCTREMRGSYLHWLAQGRKDPQVDIGYVFLFFYGLERRIIVDGSRATLPVLEIDAILTELLRLLKIYGANRSFNFRAKQLIALIWTLHKSDKPVPTYIDLNDKHHPLPLQFLLARYNLKNNIVPVELIFNWLQANSPLANGTVATRCNAEVRKLFAVRYAKEFTEGVLLSATRRRFLLTYTPASPSIKNVSTYVPGYNEPTFSARDYSALYALLKKSIKELEPYSRFLGRSKPEAKNSLAALALMPKELIAMNSIGTKIAERLKQISPGKTAFINLPELYEIANEILPAKLTNKEVELWARLFNSLGYGIAPDVRHHGVKITPTSKIAYFATNEPEFTPSNEFHKMTTIIQLGTILAWLDETLIPTEITMFQNLIINNRLLSLPEQWSLIAYLLYCLNHPQNTKGVKQKVIHMEHKDKLAIAHTLINIAQVDGRIKPKDVINLEKMYKALGLSIENLSNDIHGQITHDDLTKVADKDQARNYQIAKPKEQGFVLNEDLIKLRVQETAQVKHLLSDIFEDTDDVQIATAPETTSPKNKLPSNHQALFERLLEKDEWEQGQIDQICKPLGLMTEGALEALNDWSYEEVGEGFIDIEEGGLIYIDVKLAKEIIDD